MCPCGCGRKVRFGTKDVAAEVRRVDGVLSKARNVAARLAARGEVDDGTLDEVEQIISSGVVVRMSLLRHVHGTARTGDTPPTNELVRRVAGFEEQLLSLPERRQRAARNPERGSTRLGGPPAETARSATPSPLVDAPAVPTPVSFDGVRVDAGRSLTPMLFEVWEVAGRDRVSARLHEYIDDASAYGVLWAGRPLAADSATAMAHVVGAFEDNELWRVLERDASGYPARIVSTDSDTPVAWELETDVRGRRCVQAQFDGPWAWVDVWTFADSPHGGCAARCERYVLADRDTCAGVAEDGWCADDSEELEAVVLTVDQLAQDCADGRAAQAS